MTIPFEKVCEEISFYSPLNEMKRVDGEVERRRDPLTGRVAMTSTFFKGKKEILFPPTDLEHLTKAVEESRGSCFFCPGKVEQVTPKYLKKWLPEGRLEQGECILFPNLFPLGAIHAVIVLGKNHYRPLDDFPSNLLLDGFQAALRFTRKVYEESPSLKHFTLNCNYLFPAGASVVHPHLQLMGGSTPFTALEEIERGVINFRETHKTDYFETLIQEEKELKERFIGTTGPVHWLTPFAPLGTNEVLAIVPGCPNLLELSDIALSGLTSGLSRVLQGYHELGFSSFNFTLYSPPLGKKKTIHPVFMRIICRQNVYPFYRADDYFIQKLLGEELMLMTPEEVASELSTFF